MKATIAFCTVLLILTCHSTAYELQDGFYELGFAGPNCENSVLAYFDYLPSNCSLSNVTNGCVTKGGYSSIYSSCGSPPKQLLGEKQATWVVENRTNGPNCTGLVLTAGNRAFEVFRDSPTTGYKRTCSKAERKTYSYDHCDIDSCSNSGGFVLTYPYPPGVCNSRGNIYFCEDLSYNQAPQSPVASPFGVPVSAPVETPVSAPVSAPVSVPVSAPVSVPVSAPVSAPVPTPVSAPVSSAPVATPVSSAPVDTPTSTPENLPSPAAQSPSDNSITPTTSADQVPTWTVTLLIIGGVVIVSLIVAMVMLYIRHKRNSYVRIADHDGEEAVVNNGLK